MRFKVSMINELSNGYEETAMAKNEKEEERVLQTLKPKSKLSEAKWVNK